MTILTAPLSKLFNYLAPARVTHLNSELLAFAGKAHGTIDEQKLWDKIENLLRAGAQIDAVNKGGDTALHLLCEQHHVLAATKLLEHGASMDVVNQGGLTAFLTAARFGDADILKAFVAQKVNLKQGTVPQGDNALQVLLGFVPLGQDKINNSRERRIESLKVLVDAGMELEKSGKMRVFHHSPEFLASVPEIKKIHDLKEAIDGNDPQKVREMIAEGVHPDATVEYGDQSALGFAAATGDLDLMVIALGKGAKIDLMSGDARATPLQLAVVHGQRDAFMKLLELGANTDSQSTRYLDKPLYEAAQASSDPEMWKFVSDVLHERTKHHLALSNNVTVTRIRLKTNDRGT